jgi:hypothetical protein
MRHSKIILMVAMISALSTACRWGNSGGSNRRPAVTEPVEPTPKPTTTPPATPTSDACSFFNTVSACSAVVGCAWNGTQCVLAPTSTTTTNPPLPPLPGTNPGTPTNNYCTPFNSAALCAAGPGCIWDGSSCKIVGQNTAPQPASCTPFNTPELCAAGLNCRWNGKLCNRPSAGLGTPFKVGDGLSNIGTGTSPFANCNFSAIMGADGNFVVYQGTTPIWSTKTAGKGGTTIQFQVDGNLAMYPATGTTAIWNAGSANRGAVGILLSTSGTLAIVDANGMAVWTSGLTVPVCY